MRGWAAENSLPFQRTYAHTVLVAADQLGAAILFGRDDVTISSLCGLVRRMGRGDKQARNLVYLGLALRDWQIGLLRTAGRALERFWPGHYEGAMAADIRRGLRAVAILGD